MKQAMEHVAVAVAEGGVHDAVHHPVERGVEAEEEVDADVELRWQVHELSDQAHRPVRDEGDSG